MAGDRAAQSGSAKKSIMVMGNVPRGTKKQMFNKKNAYFIDN